MSESGLWFNFSANGGPLVSDDGGKTWRQVTDADIERVMSLESHPQSPNPLGDGSLFNVEAT